MSDDRAAPRVFAALSLFFFSGTGNSYRVATWAAQEADQAGLAVAVRPVSDPGDLTGRALSATHLLGLVTPTHGFTAPWSMLKFALRLPPGHGAGAFVMATRAGTKLGRLFLPGMEGTACYLLGLILVLKGYRLCGVVGVDMPSNWLALHPGLRPAAAQAIIAHARPRVERFLNRVLADRRAFGAGSWLCLVLGLALAQVSFMYLIMGRFMLAKLFFATSTCNGCGLCAEHCPVQAIRLWGKPPRPYWAYGCESCMRCMAYCPQRAIEVGHSWMVGLFWLTSVPVNLYLVNWLTPYTPWARVFQSGWGAFLVQYPYALLSVALAYALFTLALRWRPVNWLFAHTTLTRLYRRYQAPEVTWSDLSRGAP